MLEELPGLLRAADSLAKPAKGQPVVGERVRTAVLRLLSEGRKAAFRVLMLAQRSGVLLLAYTGLRGGEVAALRARRVDLHRRRVTSRSR